MFRDTAISVVESTPVIAEKPFITFSDEGEQGRYFLQVPPILTDVGGYHGDESAAEAGMRSGTS